MSDDLAKLGFEVDTAAMRKAADALDKMVEAGKKTNDTFKGVENSMSRLERGMRTVQSSFTLLRSAIIGLGLFRLGQGVTTAAIAFQKMETTLKFATGSLDGAGREIEFVRRESERLGQDFLTAGRAYSKLAASASQLGLSTQQIRDVFTGVSSAATVMGLSAYEAEGAFLALQQMLAKGKVQAEELTGQLGERIPTAIADAAQAMGMTTRQLYKNLELGNVQSAELVTKLSALWIQKFGTQIPTATQNANIAITDFGNAVQELQIQVARSGFLEGLTKGMEEVARRLSDPKIMEGAKTLGSTIGNLFIFMVENADDIIRVASAIGGAMIGSRLGGMLGPTGALAGGAGGAAFGFFFPEIAALLNGEIEEEIREKIVGLRPMIEEEIRKLGQKSFTLGDADPLAFVDALSPETVANFNGATRSLISSIRELQEQVYKTGLRKVAEEYGVLEDAIVGIAMSAPKAKDAVAELGKAQVSAFDKLETQTKTLGLYAAQMEKVNALTETGSSSLERAIQISKGEITVLTEREAAVLKMVAAIAEESAAQELRTRLSEKATEALVAEVGAYEAALEAFRDRQRATKEAIKDFEKSIAETKGLTAATLEGERAARVYSETLRILARDKNIGADAAARLANELIDAQDELRRTEESARFLQNTFDQAFDRIGAAITEAMATGRLEMAKLRDVGKAVISELIQAFAKLAVINPIKNAIGGAGGGLLPTLGSVFNGGGGGGGGGFSPLGLLSSLRSGLNGIGDSVTSIFTGLDNFLGLGPGLSNTGSVAGGIDAAVNFGLGGAVAPASLAFAPFLGLGAVAILSSLAGKSSGPASAATFGLDGGLLGDIRVGTDNDGDPAIAQGIGDSVKLITNAVLGNLGATLAPGSFRGEVGFVNGQFAASVAAPGLSPAGDDWDRADITGIYGLPRDLRQFGDDQDGLNAATADFVSRSIIVALNEGSIEGVSEEAANTLRIGLGNIVRGLKQGLTDEEFAQFEKDVQVLSVFDDLVAQYANVSEAASDYTRVLEQQRSELRASAAESVAGVFSPVSDLLSTARRLFDPAGPDSFQARLNLEDALRADSVGAAEGIGGAIAPNADMDWATILRGLFDDAGGVRFGRGVGPASDLVRVGGEDITDPAGLFRGGSITIGGVTLERVGAAGDEVGGNRFRATNAAGDVVGEEIITEPIGDGTDLGTWAKDLIQILVDAGADFGDAFIDEFFTPDTRDRIAEAGTVAVGMVNDIIDGLTLSDSAAVEGLSGFGLLYETQLAQIEALRPELESLNTDLAEFGLATMDVSQTIADATDQLRENVQEDFTQSLQDILDPDGAKVRAIQDNRDRLIREAGQIGLGSDQATLDLIADVYLRQLEDAGFAVDDFGNVVANVANDVADAVADVVRTLDGEITEFSQRLGALSALEARIRQQRLNNRLDPNISALSPLDRLNTAREAFETAFVAATEGPEAERAASAEEANTLSRSYLEASREYYGSSMEHLAVFNDVDEKLGVLEVNAKTELGLMQDQLDALIAIRDRLDPTEANNRDFGANPTRNRALASLFPEFSSDFGGGAFGQFFQGRLAANDNRTAAALSIIDSINFASGGVMTSHGPVPLRRYAAGGIANSPQVALFGEGSQSEAFVPLEDGRSIPVRIIGGGADSAGATSILASGFAMLDNRLARMEALLERQLRVMQREAARPRAKAA